MLHGNTAVLNSGVIKCVVCLYNDIPEKAHFNPSDTTGLLTVSIPDWPE